MTSEVRIIVIRDQAVSCTLVLVEHPLSKCYLLFLVLWRMSESESVLSFNDSYSYKIEHNPVISSIVQFWFSLNFQQKLLTVLLFWLFVNLLMIRIAWRAYGHRLSEILTKGLFQ